MPDSVHRKADRLGVAGEDMHGLLAEDRLEPLGKGVPELVAGDRILEVVARIGNPLEGVAKQGLPGPRNPYWWAGPGRRISNRTDHRA